MRRICKEFNITATNSWVMLYRARIGLRSYLKKTGLIILIKGVRMGYWMFNCNEVSRKVSDSMDRVLPFHQQMIIRFHLLMCKYCTRFRDQLLLIRKAIRAEEDFDEELRPSETSFSEPGKRIKQMLRDQLKKKSD
jgi:hypothetical protein